MPDALQLAWDNLSWMTGNVFLAWMAALLLWQVVGARGARRAAIALCSIGLLMFEVRTLASSEVDDASPWRLLLGPPLVAACSLWAWRARAGARWARWLGVVGAVAFLPNAPYVLTDGMHVVQDMRALDSSLIGALVVSLTYGVFLVAGLCGYLAALVLAHRGLHDAGRGAWTCPLTVALVLACGCGIYLGRIERWHSWHPLLEPGRFAASIGHAATEPRALAFAGVASLVVGAVTAALWRMRPERARWGPARRAMLLAAGALAAAMPLLPTFAEVADARVEPMRPVSVLVIVVVGLLVARRGARRASGLLGPSRRVALAVGVAAAFLALSTAGWWTQFRGMCDLAPDGCSSVRVDLLHVLR